MDGKSAVASTASLDQAGGKLVATLGTGPNKGRFARKFVNSAYAYVSTPGASPALNAARTRNFTAVTSPSTGEYCLTPAAGISPATSPLIVSVDWSTSLGSDLWVYWRSSGAGSQRPSPRSRIATVSSSGSTAARPSSFPSA